MSRHTVRGALVLVAALFSALSLGSVAQANSDQQLLKRHQPVTYFDPVERFEPTNVRSFVRDADLEQLNGQTWVVADPNPKLRDLPGPGTGVWRLNQDSCTPAFALGGLECYDAAEEAGHHKSVVYARVARPSGAIVLQYWYFYYDDVYSYTYPPSDFLWQAHEGDWEVVNVVLSDDEQPQYVGYSQHCLGQQRSWNLTPRLGMHPIVYVGAGSHANYFSVGTHPINPVCVPPPALALLRQLGLPPPVDYTGEADVSGPPAAGGIRTHVRVVGDDTPVWIAYPGFWGEQQYFHAPNPIGTVAFGMSPTGPAYHSVWNNPLGTIASWPSG
jgi:hypothetical protein